MTTATSKNPTRIRLVVEGHSEAFEFQFDSVAERDALRDIIDAKVSTAMPGEFGQSGHWDDAINRTE